MTSPVQYNSTPSCNQTSLLLAGRFILLLLLLLGSLGTTVLAQSDDDDDYDDDEYGEEYGKDSDRALLSPRFSKPSRGAGVGLNFGLMGVQPSELDPDLDGNFILTAFDVYVVRRGLLIGGTWADAKLYSLPDSYDRFNLGYSGLLIGYDHSLFYGRLSIRPTIMIGEGNITMVKERPDLTANPLLNPDGRVVLERLRETDFFMLRPGFGLGWSPIEFFQFRADAFFMYPTASEVSDLRKPIFNFGIVFGAVQ